MPDDLIQLPPMTRNPLGPFKLTPVPPVVTGPPETSNPQIKEGQ